MHMELARKQCGGAGNGAGNGVRRWVDSPRRRRRHRFIKACSSGIEENFVKGLLCGQRLRNV